MQTQTMNPPDTATIETPAKGKRGAPTRPEFDLTTAVNSDGNPIAIADGRLTAVPANWTSDSQNLKRENFTKRVLFLQWQLASHDLRVVKMAATREKMVQTIDDALHPMDPTSPAAKARKLSRLQEQIAKLQAELADSGIELPTA